MVCDILPRDINVNSSTYCMFVHKICLKLMIISVLSVGIVLNVRTIEYSLENPSIGLHYVPPQLIYA